MFNYLTIENLLIKKILILFIVCLSIFLSFSYVFGDYHNTIDYSHYSNPFPSFEISYPSDWEILDYSPILSIPQNWVLTSKFEISFGLPEELVYATILIEPTNLSLTEYSQFMIGKMMEKVTSKVFPHPNNISISGYPAYQVTTNLLDNHLNEEMNVVETWTVNNGIASRFSFYSPIDNSNYIYPPIIDSVIENMTKSFRLIN